MLRKFTHPYHIPGTLSANLNIRFKVPSHCTLRHDIETHPKNHLSERYGPTCGQLTGSLVVESPVLPEKRRNT